tara:strand:+ start:1015 stop:1182 length:168 start_codon:yes stop_codon:yes gene_type:complete
MSVDDIHKQDKIWVERLKSVANETDDWELSIIAERFETLTDTAATRRHWCNGNEK